MIEHGQFRLRLIVRQIVRLRVRLRRVHKDDTHEYNTYRKNEIYRQNCCTLEFVNFCQNYNTCKEIYTSTCSNKTNNI